MPDAVIAQKVERPVEPSTTICIPFACGACAADVQGRAIDAVCPRCARPLREQLPNGPTLRFYHLTPELAACFARGMVIRALCKVAPVFIALGILAVVWRGFSLAVVLPFGVALVAIIATAQALLGKATRDYERYALVVGNDEILQRRGSEPELRLRRERVTYLQETPRWFLSVTGPSRQFQIMVPAAMDGFEDLRTELLTWGPLRGRWESIRGFIPNILSIAGAMLSALMVAQGETPELVVLGAAACACGCLGHSWIVYRNPSHTRAWRWGLIALLMLAAVLMVKMALRRLLG